MILHIFILLFIYRSEDMNCIIS
eukprot:UN07319